MSTIDLTTKTHRFIRLLNSAMTQSFAPLEVGTQQARILRYISSHEGCSASELSEYCSCDPAGIGRAIDALVKKKWILRKEHPHDRRLWTLHLTIEGKKKVIKLNKILQKTSSELFSTLNSKECEQYEKNLEKLCLQLDEMLKK